MFASHYVKLYGILFGNKGLIFMSMVFFWRPICLRWCPSYLRQHLWRPRGSEDVAEGVPDVTEGVPNDLGVERDWGYLRGYF